MGLSLVLDANVNDYSVTNGKFDGFKVIGENKISKILAILRVNMFVRRY
jgi:hypothetical protein